MTRLEPLFRGMIQRYESCATPTEDPTVYVCFESHGPCGALVRMTRDQVVQHLRPDACEGTRGLLQQMKTYRCESERILCMVGDAELPFEVRSDVLKVCM